MPTPQVCVNGGWPQFDAFGFSFKRTAPSDSGGGAALTWEQLKDQIDNGKPVAFSWRFIPFGGGHMMVAIGYNLIGDQRWVIVNDPWPPGTGARRSITYETYVSGESDGGSTGGSEHWFDFYDIVQGPGGIMTRPIAPADFADALVAARAFLGKALEASGHNAPGAAASSYLGDGLPVKAANLQLLQQKGPGGTSDDALERDATHVVFPVMLGGQMIASTTAHKLSAGTWDTHLGNQEWARRVFAARQRHAILSDTPETEYFLLAASPLKAFFLGHYKGADLVLVSILSDPGLGVDENQELPADVVFERLRQAAQRHNRSPG